MTRPKPEAPGSGRAYQQIAEDLESSILTGQLKPGDHIPSERELVERYGVSRPTVREALRILESGHLVRSRSGDRRGPVVLPPSPLPMQKALARLVVGETVGLAILLQYRMIVESAAALLAAHHRTDPELLAMERANARTRAAVELGYQSFSVADRDFLGLVAVASRNPLLEMTGEVVRGLIQDLVHQRVIYSGDIRAKMMTSIQHHDEVLAAIQDQNGALAAWLVRDGMCWYYSEYIADEEQSALRDLADEAKVGV